MQDIVESPTLLKSVSILTAEGSDGSDATHITLLVDGKIYFLRPEFLVSNRIPEYAAKFCFVIFVPAYNSFCNLLGLLKW